MNLRVDLILETEQRSASFLNLKSLMRIAMIVVPLIVAAVVGKQVMTLLVLKNELSALEARWQTTEPLQKKAIQLAQECQANTDVLSQLNGWRKSHVDWHVQLLDLMKVIPGSIQMLELRLGQSLQVIDDKVPARVFSLELKGRAYGQHAESSVKNLEKMLTESTPFTNYVQKVEVPMFGADTSAGAGKSDRVFEIRCSYRERKFE